MKIKFTSVIVVAALVASIAVAAMPKAPKADIVDTAVGAKGFTTLVTAVKAAGLVDALKGKGPFTVFAPTDEAFKKLEKENPGITAKLLKPENKKMLADILKYHVVSGNVMAKDVLKLKNGTMVKTLGGKTIKISNKGGVMVNNAKVTKTDIECTNGVIHVIDTVLVPKSK
ncbi:MAG: fasciclin domain-containing protein [Fimbriimonadaceae bacterium]